MSELLSCPFCGGVPKTSHRPESEAAGGGHKAFVVCYCAGYASTAHQMGHAGTVQAAIAEAVEKWNTRAQLPSQGGEAVEVVAHLVLGGLFHGGSGPELGDIDYQIEVGVAERLQRENVKTAEDVQLELMTVAQHQRILAANAGSAEPVFMWHRGATEEESEVVDVDCACPCCVPLYTHPADQVAEPLKQIAWKRRDGVMGCSRFMTQKRYDAQSPQMKGNYEPFYCAHCKADQVEDDLTMVKVSRELLERIIKRGMRLPDETQHQHLEELRALLADSGGVKK